MSDTFLAVARDTLAGLLPLTADLSALVGSAASIAAEAFTDGSPTPETVERAITDGVRAGLASLPVDLPKGARLAIADAIGVALAWIWRELQPAVIVSAGESELVVVIVDEPEPLPPDPDPPITDP